MKPNSVKARVMAGDWHDKTVKEIAAELNCSKVSVTQALEAIEEETGEPVPHKSGDKREKLIINGKELTLTEALLESDWSDLDAKGIADVLGVKPERVTAALYRYRTRTGKEIPHVKSKRGPKPKKKEPETDKPKEPDPAEPEDSPESDAAEMKRYLKEDAKAMKNKKNLNPLRDKQQDKPVARCSACGGVIYPGELCYRVDLTDKIYCMSCITVEEAGDDT